MRWKTMVLVNVIINIGVRSNSGKELWQYISRVCLCLSRKKKKTLRMELLNGKRNSERHNLNENRKLLNV